MVRQMHRAGVRFVAGTDQGGNPTDYAGFSLHDDLALYVRAGFTPLEALQTATRNAAQLLGMLDSVGTIEKGKVADLVLLDANPLDDIRSVSRVYAVVLNGRLIDADERRRRLADLEQQARAY